MRSRRVRRWSMAGAPSGSLSKTTARRAAPPSRRDHDLRRGRGRLLARADHRGDAGLAGDERLQAGELRRAPGDAGREDVDLRGRDDPGREAAAGRVVGAAHLVPAGSARTRLSPSAVERTLRAAKTSSPMAMRAIGSATGREEATRDSTRRQRGVWCSRASSPVRRTAVTGRVRRSGSLPLGPAALAARRASGGGRGLLAQLPGAEQPRAEQRHERGDERDRTARVMSVVAARPGPKARKNCRWPTTSAAVPAATMRPGGDDDRRDLGDRAARGGQALVARAQPAARLGQEEDRVVGHEPQQEHDDDRLDLLGHRDVGALAQPRQHAHRDRVGDARSGQRHERGADRAEGEGHDERDEHHAGRLDERQRLLDLVELRLARGRRAGDPDDRGARAAERLLGVVLGDGALVVEARAGREEQVGDGRGAALARRGAHVGVAQRDGRLEGLERRVAAVADGERGVELAALGVLRRGRVDCAGPRRCRWPAGSRTCAWPAPARSPRCRPWRRGRRAAPRGRRPGPAARRSRRRPRRSTRAE